MAKTIKGGAYQNPDGSWVDANGKPLPSSKVQEAQALQREQAAEIRQADLAIERQAGVSAVTAGTPLPPLDDVEVKAKPKRKKNS